MTGNLGTFGEGKTLEILVHFLHDLLEGGLLLLGLHLFSWRDLLSSGGREGVEEPLQTLLLLQAL